MSDLSSVSPRTTAATGTALPGLPIIVHWQSEAGAARVPASMALIIGAAGDLTERWLMPILHNLAGSYLLDAGPHVVGVDHSHGTYAGWRLALTDAMQMFIKGTAAEFYAAQINPAAWDWVRHRLTYLGCR